MKRNGYVGAMAPSSHTSHARMSRSSGWVSGFVLVVVACGGGAAEEPSAGETTTSGAAPVTTAISDGSRAATPTTGTAPPPEQLAATNAPAPEATEVVDIWAVTEPVEVVIEWDCDGELIDRGGGLFVSACMSGRIEPWFMNANWFVGIRYIRDDDGVPVAIDATANGYSGHCMWNHAGEATFDEAPIVDGKATHEGVLFGDGRCEGLRFVYENTWDVELLTNVTSGIIEPIE